MFEGFKFGGSKKERVSAPEPEVSPEAKRQETLDRIEGFLRNYHEYAPIDEFVKLRDSLAAKGGISADEINALPMLKGAAERSLVKILHQDAIHHAAFDVDAYIKMRDKWVVAGIVTVHEADNFPGIQGIAKDDLYNTARAVNAETSFLAILKKKYVDAGILSERVADELIRDGRKEREEYLRSPGGA